MVLSVSRRTDIPALYADWFLDRVKDGFVLTANPFFPCGKVARVQIEPVRVTENLLGGKEITGNVDGIIFWTKNPRPMFERLHELDEFKYYFHFTLNPYDEKIEINVPPLDERIETFKELSEKIGKEKAIWRYDPILMSKDHDIEYHLKNFEELAKQLSGYATSCMISFLIPGKNKSIWTPSHIQRDEILKRFAQVTRENGMQLYACALKDDWSKYGIKKAQCTDPELFAKLTGGKVKTKRLDRQRKNCGCIPCVDIGVYNTCTHDCVYCYANGFYGYRGEPKSMLDELDGEIYERKTERIFEYV